MNFIRRHFFIVWCLTLAIAVIALSVFVGILVKSSVSRAEKRDAKLTREYARRVARRAAALTRAAANGAEERACQRLNVLRASDNRRAKHFFEFNGLEVSLIAASLKHQTASINRTPEQREHTEQFVAKLAVLVSDEEWIGLTNCHAAVHDPDYSAPSPVRFSARKAPPSALGR